MNDDPSLVPEEHRDLWSALEHAAPEPLPRAGFRRIGRVLEMALDVRPGERGVPPRTRRPATVAAVAAGIALLMGGAVGFGLGTTRAAGPGPGDAGSATGESRYLLLVRDTEAVDRAIRDQGVDVIVERYAAWAAGLAEEGRLVRAEKLTDTPRWVGEGARSSSPISGFFLVRAADEAEALAIARASPHVALGGVLEVRGIDDVER